MVSLFIALSSHHLSQSLSFSPSQKLALFLYCTALLKNLESFHFNRPQRTFLFHLKNKKCAKIESQKNLQNCFCCRSLQSLMIYPKKFDWKLDSVKFSGRHSHFYWLWASFVGKWPTLKLWKVSWYKKWTVLPKSDFRMHSGWGICCERLGLIRSD